MSYVRELLAGLLIIVASGLIGVAQNAARDDSIPLVPRSSRELVQNKPVTEPSLGPKLDSSESTVDESLAATETDSPDWPTEAELSSGELSKERLRVLMETGNIIIIDARSATEFGAGHIAGAINIPYDDLVDQYNRLRERVPLDAVVVCYCESVTCDESENLARELGFMGYSNVLIYKGGWQEWETTGLPTEETHATE
jgi:rhodanese-related sulfurtransferase